MGPSRAPSQGIERAIVTLDHAFASLLPLVAFLVAGAGVLFRQSGIPKVLTIWAEDGSIFATCAYARPLVPDCLLEPYAGWIHVIPRAGAALAVLWPPADLSVVIGMIAAAVAGLTAAVVAIAVRDASGSWVAGLIAGASLVLVRQAGIEVGGSLTNLHWILMAASIVLIVAWWVGARAGPGSLVVLASAGLSSPFAPILVPLGLVGLLLRRPGWRPVLAIVCVTAAAQIAVILITPRVPPGSEPFNPGLVLSQFLRDVLGFGAFGHTRLPLNRLIQIGIVAVVAVAAVLAIDARRAPDGTPSADHTPPDARAAALRSMVVVVALIGTGIVLFVAIVFLQHKYNARYGYIPSALLCVALVFGSALVGRANPVGGGARRFLGWATRLALPAAVVLLTFGFARTFRLETKASGGPDYADAFRDAATACDGQASRSILVPISPISRTNWAVEIPCSRVAAPTGR